MGSAAKSVLQTILDWSANRPNWQRDALRRIVQKGRLSEDDISDLIALCKHERGGPVTQIKLVALEKQHLPANPAAAASVALLAIKNVEGANILAPSQTLSFAPLGITITYGDNGAGKSGYARILKRACRARSPGIIHGNIYASAPAAPARAIIEYSVGGTEQAPEAWVDSDSPHPALSAVSVFDSDCASIHIESKNEVAFRPFGLDVPDELANVCQRMKDVLTAEQKLFEKARNPLFLKPPWKETTVVGKALGVLRHNTPRSILDALATLTDEQRARLNKLREDLSKDPTKAAAEQKAKADNIKGCVDALALVRTAAADVGLNALFALFQDAKAKRAAAAAAAAKAFTGEKLQGIGAEVWRALWESARRYSTTTAYPSEIFPPTEPDSLCVLCQQPLPEQARERMARFERFVQEDTERHAQEAEKALTTSIGKLAAHRFSTRAIAANLRQLAIEDPSLAKLVRRFAASARLRRFIATKAISDNADQIVLPPFPVDPHAEVSLLENRVRQYAEELRLSSKPDERRKLQLELAELSDRAALQDSLQAVLDEIDRLKMIHFLGECIADTNTSGITKLGNDIADTLITPQLRDRFQEEIVRLAADKVRVEIVRSGGRFGSPQYKIRFFAKPDANVTDVLSEGEKTCVALAAFLTELATASHTSTLVFDDPVSSLDHRWRKQVAKRLVEEAQVRQIIVFTHDLVFVNDLSDLAQAQGKLTKFITLNREQAGAGIVSDGLPWKAKSVEDRIDKLEKEAREAKKLYEANDDTKYGHVVTQLYGHMRASWERAIEEIVFFKIVRRHRDYIDTKYLKKVTVLIDTDCDAFHTGFKKCCDVVDAHDPSIGRNASPPPPPEVMRDIQSLKDWVTAIRTRQAAIK